MIEFIKPSFNTFTLNFPPLTEAEQQKAQRLALLNSVHAKTAVEHGRLLDIRRKERRNLCRLRAAVAGGFHLHGRSTRMETPAPEPTGLTRAERRRAQFGRK